MQILPPTVNSLALCVSSTLILGSETPNFSHTYIARQRNLAGYLVPNYYSFVPFSLLVSRTGVRGQ